MDLDTGFYQRLIDTMSDGVYVVDRNRTITYWSRGAERLTGYTAGDVIGRACSDGVLNHVDSDGNPLCARRCPLEASISGGDAHEMRMWMHHADGHFQPVWVRTDAIFDPDGYVIGAVEVFGDDAAKGAGRTRSAEWEHLDLVDPLTGLGNDRYLTTQLATRCDEFDRYGWPFGVLIADIDHLEGINEEFGPAVGDNTIVTVARTLSYALRRDDSVVRRAGDEFVILLPHVDPDVLAAVAERLRSLVAACGHTVKGRPVAPTMSIGGTMAQPGDDPKTVLDRAGGLLLTAKSFGHNQVAVDSVRSRG